MITEITGHFEVFYPSVVVGGLTYYFTELLQMKSFNVILYEDMVSSSDFQEEKRYALSVEVMTGSYLTARRLVSCPCPNIALSSVCIGTEKTWSRRKQV